MFLLLRLVSETFNQSILTSFTLETDYVAHLTDFVSRLSILTLVLDSLQFKNRMGLMGRSGGERGTLLSPLKTTTLCLGFVTS